MVMFNFNRKKKRCMCSRWRRTAYGGQEIWSLHHSQKKRLRKVKKQPILPKSIPFVSTNRSLVRELNSSLYGMQMQPCYVVQRIITKQSFLSHRLFYSKLEEEEVSCIQTHSSACQLYFIWINSSNLPQGFCLHAFIVINFIMKMLRKYRIYII